jgi:hypothetical protein
LNQLIDDQRKELRKREYLTYNRRNKDSTPPSQNSTPPPSTEKVVSPPPSTEKVVSPPPPLVHELFPNLSPTKDEIQLIIYVAARFGNLNMMVLIPEM